MIFAMVAGEISGDHLGAGLIDQLRILYPEAEFVGIGGPKMQAAGLVSWYPMERLSIMGLVEVLKHLPGLLRLRHQLYQRFLALKPAAFIGIDAPDFNLGLSRKLHKKNIKTVHYVSPSVWAWRQNRIHGIKKSIDLMLTVFPFELDFYKKHQVSAVCVGHTLADALPLDPTVSSSDNHAAQKKIAVLPGSRGGEVKYIGPVFIATMKNCLAKRSDLLFKIPMANEKRKQQFIQLLKEHWCEDWKTLPVEVSIGNSLQIMAACELILLASGTATLEGLLLKKPMVVAYAWHPLTHRIVASLLKVKNVSLPNLLAGEPLLPEYIQEDCTPENLTEAVLNWGLQTDHKNLIEKFSEIHESLRKNSDVVAAQSIQGMLEKS